MSINVEYNNKEINQIVLENVLKMLERRQLIDSWSDVYSNLEDTDTKSIFQIVLNNKSSLSIYLVNAKLTSIVQGTPLDDYLSNNIDIHKIIIARDVAKKVIKQIVSEYKNAEFFFESEMLEDIPSKGFIPIHKLLNEDEKNELLSKFSENELSRILITDMMSRYYGAKLGDIFKIIRPSFTAGKNVFYRRVVNGSWDILFPS
jgi:DNA-directed RNA polymerase I, II, and III subunit RPABC1